MGNTGGTPGSTIISLPDCLQTVTCQEDDRACACAQTRVAANAAILTQLQHCTHARMCTCRYTTEMSQMALPYAEFCHAVACLHVTIASGPQVHMRAQLCHVVVAHPDSWLPDASAAVKSAQALTSRTPFRTGRARCQQLADVSSLHTVSLVARPPLAMPGLGQPELKVTISIKVIIHQNQGTHHRPRQPQ